MTRGVQVKTNPEVIKYYLNKSELIQEELVKNKKLKFIDKWLEGSRNPTLNQLTELSNKLQVPLGYLIVKEPIDDTPELLNYRTVDSMAIERTSRNLIDTIKIAKSQQEYVSEYRKKNGHSPLKYVGKHTVKSDLEEVIQDTRVLLNIPKMWQKDLKNISPLKYFRRKLNEIGIIIQRNGIVGQNTRRTLDINEFRAFVIVDEFAPLIFINTNDTENGQLFSLLHEFGHILLGMNEVYNIDVSLNHNENVSEILCNRIASEILVPNERFKEEWNINHDEGIYEYVIKLANQFKVSKTVIGRKALDNNFITKNQYFEIARRNYKEYDDYKQREQKNRDKGGGNYYNTLQSRIDPTLFNVVVNDYYDRNIQYNEALKLLNIGTKGFEFLSEKFNVNGVEIY